MIFLSTDFLRELIDKLGWINPFDSEGDRMHWLYLILAGFFEVGFAVSLKLSQGFTKVLWIVAFLAFSIVSLWLLNKAMEVIPLGTAYAVWTGIGAVGTTTLGIIIFKDPATAARLFFMCMLIVALVGLKAVTK